MCRALAIKELRELSGIAAVAVALGLALVVYQIQIQPRRYSRAPWAYGQPVVPFVSDDFVVYFSFIAAAFAIALGFRLSLGEEFRGTYPFLLHRPISRRAVMLTKLLTGGAIYLVCSAVPILT
ncbi:MAG: ABC transporter permease subunit, partial [Planctomycetes bacterium]|nr:ABC transporter permease subunit [Planctomycetota bacterium]